uniref:Flowering time control protein FCA n=1 Tax=Noccaea caerulescens TaxID=107243 RepID=A0A1J3IX19_NOCCA
MTRYDEDDEAFSRHRRRGNSPSSYRVGIGGGGNGGRHWEGDSPTDRDVHGEGGGFRPMNGPPGRIDFQPMVPRDSGSFRAVDFGFDGSVEGFRPMGPDGASGVRGGFRPSGPVMFPPSESPDEWGFSGGRGFQAPIGKVMEPDYSVRLTSPPVQQPLSGQKRGRPLSEHGNFTGTDVSDRTSIVKLFVGSVPRTALEEEVRPLFEQHGNVLEVALIKDKRTGQQQGMFISILLVIYTFFLSFRSPEKADGKQPQSHHWPPFVCNKFRGYLCSFITAEGYLCSLLRKGFYVLLVK